MPSRSAAGADWAFISDASALVIADEVEPASSDTPLPLLRVVLIDEVRNTGTPRDPVSVANRFCIELRKRSIYALASDSHYVASWQPALADAGIDWIPAPTKQDEIAAAFLMLRVLLHSNRLDLPNNPRLKRQLADVQARAGQGGSLVVQSKRRKDGDGGTSHGDIVSALVLAVWQLTQGAADYTHAAVRARGADLDPRTQDAKVEIVGGVMPRGEFEEYADDLEG